jgi:hypothetical protein
MRLRRQNPEYRRREADRLRQKRKDASFRDVERETDRVRRTAANRLARARRDEDFEAWKLIQEYGDDCPICSYSVLAPMSRIERHTGPENRTGEYIRVHVPLISPEGDCFFEANGDEIDWSDIWAFHNQVAHSAHNNTKHWRLVFLIDFRRAAIGMEPGEPFDESFDEHHVEPFVRKPKAQ